MNTTEANQIVHKSSRCTQATLAAFGLDAYPLKGSGCLSYLTEAGYTVKICDDGYRSGVLLKYWYTRYMDFKKNYLIFTNEHAMACIGGVLVDTMNEGFNVRRIEQVFEVSKNDSSNQ